MKILILITLLFSSFSFANCSLEKAIGAIEDYMHEKLSIEEQNNLSIVPGLDYSLHGKIIANLNEVQHTYSYSQKFISNSQEGKTCKEIFIVFNCSVANLEPTHRYFNCKI